ncbi:MAG: iron-containing alcohol dehydrogenase [Anaerolineaceae bacterium]|nr:iron-containing alcohol dehydrogenase [Anaerolineaceae bacterium]
MKRQLDNWPNYERETRMQLISMEEFLNLDAAGMAGKEVEIDGVHYNIPIPIIRVGAGVVNEVPQIAENALGHKPQHPYVIFDEVIRGFVTEKVIKPLVSAGMNLNEFSLASEDPAHHLAASDAVGDAGAEALAADCDFIIGAGSGVIGDLTKWIANKRDIPFVIVGTAGSMNGHASITAAMSFGNIKETAFDLKIAEAVIYDTEILADAPLVMNLAGFSDMLARNTCVTDWKLSEILRGVEGFVSLPYEMMIKTQDLSFQFAAQIPEGKPQAVAALGEACLISGMTMTILGGLTSPSSGVEHVISHFWDLLNDVNGKDHFWHGTQVGVGVLLGLTIYEMLSELDPSTLNPEEMLKNRRSMEEIEAHLRAAYPQNADHFIQTAHKKRIKDENYLLYISNIIDHWDSIWNALAPYRIAFKALRTPMKAAGAATTLSEVHQTAETARQVILDGNFYRPRYTVLDFAWELGLFPARIDEVMERAEVL